MTNKELINNYKGELSSEDLEICNRQELPWIDTRQGCKISDACNNYLDDQVIYLYYNRELVRNQIQ